MTAVGSVPKKYLVLSSIYFLSCSPRSPKYSFALFLYQFTKKMGGDPTDFDSSQFCCVYTTPRLFVRPPTTRRTHHTHLRPSFSTISRVLLPFPRFCLAFVSFVDTHHGFTRAATTQRRADGFGYPNGIGARSRLSPCRVANFGR